MRYSPYARVAVLTMLLVGLALRLGAQTSVNQAISLYDQLIRNYNLIS